MSLNTEDDLLTAYGGRFIFPQKAEGVTAHDIKGRDLSVKVDFVIEAGRFSLNGALEDGVSGVVVSGIINTETVNVTHISITDALRGKGLGNSLLYDLESQFKQLAIKLVYASFANPETVKFFLKNGYEIIPLNSLGEQKEQLGLGPENYETRVGNYEDFNKLEKAGEKNFSKILLRKEISK